MKRVTSLGNPGDTALLFRAIRMAMTPKVLGSVDDFDVFNESVFNRIYDEKTTLIDIFKKCAKRDAICSEWVSNFNITFDMGYPYLKKSLNQTHDINLAIVSTFLYILSEIPDSLIIRKCGYEKALEVSKRAKSIMDLGGAFSELGFKMIRQLDLDLQSKGGNINPGTSADLTASSIFIALLEGWRP